MDNLNESVSVITVYDCQTGLNQPKEIVWRGRQYQIDKVGLRHSFWKGKVLIHIFSVLSGQNFIRLRLETERLEWSIDSFEEDQNG